MVAPIHGPFTKVEEFLGEPAWTGYRPPAVTTYRTWYTQRKPYDQPLTFELDKWVTDFRTYEGDIRKPGGFSCQQAPSLPENGYISLANNKSYAKLVDETQDASQWANNLIEAGKSLSVAEQRLIQLAKFAKQIATHQYTAAARTLGFSKAPRAVSQGKSYGKNWLEYHFMWTPMMGDIRNGMKALTRDFSPVKVKGRGRHIVSSTVYHTGQNGDRITVSYDTKVRHDAFVRIVNPNASLANELGLVNLGSILWEAVPFSFVADWFGNVGQVLSSATDFVGKELSSSSTTVYQVAKSDNFSYGYLQYGLDPPYGGEWTAHEGATRVYVRRSMGITGPSLSLKPFKGFSVTRGATAVALLLGFLPKR